MNHPTHTVLVKLEAKPNKVQELKELLTGVIGPSRSEKTCIEYRLHQDINNSTQFLLYENWVDKRAHEAQFTKPYIQELGDKIGNLLAKPYEIIFASELHKTSPLK